MDTTYNKHIFNYYAQRIVYQYDIKNVQGNLSERCKKIKKKVGVKWLSLLLVTL